MSVRKLTPSELEDNTIARIEAGAVGQCAVVCRCGRVEHFPNSEFVQDCLVKIQSCDWCRHRWDDTDDAFEEQ